MNRKYTDEELIAELHRFVEENGRVPEARDMNNSNGYPSESTFTLRFNNWNNALKIAGLPINRYETNTPRICSVCGINKVDTRWCYNSYKDLICSKCYSNDRKYIKGILSLNSTTGIGVITEHVAYIVLNDCIKCNTEEHFSAPYDLISEEYGTINVKCAVLTDHHKNKCHSMGWKFPKKINAMIPNYYICLGFDENRIEILKVWTIPGNADIVAKSGITISQTNLQRASQYEVDSTPYNEVYKNLDIYSLPEFCNLNLEGACG